MAKEIKQFFTRRNLWLMILVLIPLIQILNSTGPKPDQFITPDEFKTEFTIDDINVERYEHDYLVQVLKLNSNEISIAIASPELPLALPNSDLDNFYRVIQNNHSVTQITLELDDKLIKQYLNYVADLLPPFNQDTKITLAGPLTDENIEWILDHFNHNFGQAIPWQVKEQQALTTIKLPEMNSVELNQLLMVVSIIADRMSGYQVKADWNFEQEQAYLYINSTLDPAWLMDINENEFELARSASISRMNAPRNQHNLTKIVHRYAIYGDDANSIKNEVNDYQSYTLEQINQVLAKYFGEFKTNLTQTN